MSDRIEASAPGKVILMGEHAAVYGKPALVAAIDRRVRVGLAPEKKGVVLDLRDLSHLQVSSWREILAYRDRKLEEWTAFREGRPIPFDVVRGQDPAHLVKLALGEAARSLVGDDDADLPPVRLVVRSEIPVGSGFGSSAAVAVAVVAAALHFFSGSSPTDRVARIALDVERRQHGHPSGVDHRTVLAGGLLFFSRGEDPRPLDVSEWVRESFAVFDTGAPGESTGDVVAAVRRLRERNRTAFDVDLARMAENVAAFRDLITSATPDAPGLRRVLETFESWLEDLGIVPLSVRRALERLPGIGAVGKISGAGTLSGEGAGCIVVFRPPERSAEVRRLLADFRPIEASIGADGLSVQEVA